MVMGTCLSAKGPKRAQQARATFLNWLKYRVRRKGRRVHSGAARCRALVGQLLQLRVLKEMREIGAMVKTIWILAAEAIENERSYH